MHRTTFSTALAFGLAALAISPAANAAANPAIERRFTQTVRPFLQKYCVGCHSGSTPAAQFDLAGYTTVAAVMRDHPRWATVVTRLDAGEMPPKQMPQPPAEAKKQVVDWIQAARADEIRRNAGDPGSVLARRLSNAEYDYSIRDLTGVDMKPTREFPVDPANPAGFDNSGESLTMSPALLKKYLDAARQVGDHMYLTPDGVEFAPYPMLVETDREKYTIQRIVNFYLSQPTDYAGYFEAAWRYKNRAALGKPNATLESFATEAKLSPKYIPLVWSILEEPKDVVGPVAKLQGMWKALPAPGAATPEALRAKCVEMRDFTVRIRNHTAMQFAAPKVKGLASTSQPLMNWKLRQFAASRRKFDPKALREEGEAPPDISNVPKLAGLGQEAAVRWAALTMKARAGDNDLVFPKGQRAEYEAAFARFANVFPDAFYIKERGRFFPDDSEDKGRLLSAGFHNVMGYFRDDTPLIEMILDEKGKKELDRLWLEFDFVADHTIRTYTQYFFNQSGEVRGLGRESGTVRPADKEVTDESVIMGLRGEYLAKADAPGNDPVAMEAIKDHFQRVNTTIREILKMRQDAEPKHLEALLKFEERAFRRPLTKAEKDDMLAYYKEMRGKAALSHEDAMRQCIVSVLMSPDFTYRIDLAPALSQGPTVRTAAGVAKPVSATTLASRLSYFLWSSVPDAELAAHASAGDLAKPDVLLAQARRMMKDARVRDFAAEFGGNWLDFRHFQTFNSVDRERFPTFNNDLRDAMFEEPIRFIEDVIRSDRSVLDMLYGDYTWVNPVLAKHYGMPEVKGSNDTWVKVDDAAKYQRGGLLPMSVFLTQNSPGLRTSPVKRGYWVVHKLLGETIPPPPPVVPELPHDEAKSELPIRDMLAKHRETPMCNACHSRFDTFGLAFENYGPVGDARTKDLAGRNVDTHASLPGGVEAVGLQGVRDYIRQRRQTTFVDNFNRKLLAYALNRSLQLSDEAVVEKMNTRLAANGYKMSTLIEAIVTSPQFTMRRAPEVRQSTTSAKPAPPAAKPGA